MPGRTLAYHEHPLRHVRLDTLVRLRWIAVFGQSAAVLMAHDAIHVAQFWTCLGVIGLYAALNIFLSRRFRGDRFDFRAIAKLPRTAGAFDQKQLVPGGKAALFPVLA